MFYSLVAATTRRMLASRGRGDYIIVIWSPEVLTPGLFLRPWTWAYLPVSSGSPPHTAIGVVWRTEVILTELLSDKIHSSLFSMHLVMQIVSDMYCIVVYPRPWAVPWCCRGQCSVIYVSYWTRAGPKSGKLPRFWILRLQRDRGGQQRPRPPI